ncbi:MAG: hypothetical protein Fur0037_02020 [Planctomycetota bacterium]
MALLNRSAAGPVRRFLFASLLAAFAAGCAMLGWKGTGAPLAFPHARHLQEGLECGDCHADWETSDRPGMPSLAACKLCHDEIDADKPENRRVDSLFGPDGFKAARVSKLPADVIFSHQRHAGGGVECAACHKGIEQSVRVDARLAPVMPDCISCHKKMQRPADCATCHHQQRADVPPRTHEFQWVKLHGRTVREHSPRRIDDCSICHREDTCNTCHRDTPPESHDNYFRRRAHGLYARMDRENCAACHRTDSCDRCHRETEPVNHVGTWGGTQSTHCLSCHLPLAQNDCATCHRSTPSHDSATPLPSNHSPGMNCRQCHGQGQPLPHVDKGDTCTSCHR